MDNNIEKVTGIVGSDARAITAADGSDLPRKPAFVYCGVGGNISVDPYQGGNTAVVFKGVAAGTILPVRVNRVRSTSTTATDLVAIYV
jgi:hypothetical protein